MSKCVKSLILKEFENTLHGIFAIKTVLVNPYELPLADSHENRPFTAMYDDPEINIRIINNYRQAEFPLLLASWCWCDNPADMNDTLDELFAQQQKAFNIESASFRQYIKNMTEESYEKFFSNENECALLYRWNVTYRHLVGDPYTIN